MAKNMEKSSARAEKAENRDNRIAEKAEFHARAQAQKVNFRNLKDMTSDMQKIGQANKADGRGAKEEATMVFAENRKQALLQFAYKRMGFITDSHVCRKNGADVIIDNEVQSDTDSSIDFMIQEDALTGKFWLLMKVDGAAELQSLDVSLLDSEGNGSWNAQQAQLAESKLNADNKNSQSDSDFWNVLVEDTYFGDSTISAEAVKAFSSGTAADAGIEWVYCTERRPVGSNGEVFPRVETEADNDSEPACADEADCLKAYFSHGDVKGWAVLENGAWTSLPSGAIEEDICLSGSVANFAYNFDTSACADLVDYTCFGDNDFFIDSSAAQNMYSGISIKGSCSTLSPSNAEYTTIREVGPDGALTVFYDSVNDWAIYSAVGDIIFYENADCTGRFSSGSSSTNDFMTHAVDAGGSKFPLMSIQAVGIECLDISEIPSRQNMNVVSDAMYWNDGASWVWIRMSQKTPFHATRMQVDYKGASNIGKFHVHAYQSDNLADCTSVGGHYNPTDMALNDGDNQETYEVGDLSGKHGTFADWGVTDDAGSKVFYDVNLPLWGSNSVAARGVVLHDAASGARAACGNFGHMCSVWDRQPKFDEIKIDYNGEDVWGYQVLQQRKGCPWCATSVKSYFRYKDAADDFWTTVCADTEHALFAVCDTGSAESKFHIHTIRDEVNEWAGCNNNGGHYNPQVGVPCMSGTQGPNGDLCELGDLSNKLGKLVIGNAGWTTSQTTDLYAPLTESSLGYQFSNRSITIHAPSGARLTCGPTDLE